MYIEKKFKDKPRDTPEYRIQEGEWEPENNQLFWTVSEVGGEIKTGGVSPESQVNVVFKKERSIVSNSTVSLSNLKTENWPKDLPCEGHC